MYLMKIRFLVFLIFICSAQFLCTVPDVFLTFMQIILISSYGYLFFDTFDVPTVVIFRGQSTLPTGTVEVPRRFNGSGVGDPKMKHSRVGGLRSIDICRLASGLKPCEPLVESKLGMRKI